MKSDNADLPLHPVIFQTQVNQLGDIVCRSFLHTMAFVVFNGMDAKFQFVGYHLTAEPVVAQPDYLHFTP